MKIYLTSTKAGDIVGWCDGWIDGMSVGTTVG